jgi:hypothetical protein
MEMLPSHRSHTLGSPTRFDRRVCLRTPFLSSDCVGSNGVFRVPPGVGLSYQNQLISISQCTVIGGTLSLLTKEGFILPGGYSYSRNWATRGCYEQVRHGVYVPLPGACRSRDRVLVLGVASHYGHFYVDLLDRLQTLKLDEWDGVIVDAISDWSLEMLEFYGIHVPHGKLIELPAGRSCFFSRADCYSGRSGKPYWSPDTVRLVREAARARGFLGASQSPPPKRKIFITRENSRQRQLLNLDSLRSEFKEFEFVDTGKLSLRKQIEIFSQASTVIGPIGSDLFNILFCFPGVNVVCLAAEKYVRASGDNVIMLQSLCGILKLKLAFIGCDAVTESYDSDITVPVDALRSVVLETPLGV